MPPAQKLVPTGFVSLICVGTALWFCAYVLRGLLGDHPALLDVGLIIVGFGVAGLSLWNVQRGQGKQHAAIAVASIGLIVLAGRSLVTTLGAG